MTNTPTTPIQELWQQQPVEGTRMSIDEIRRRATKFEKKIMWRNLREYVSGGIASILFVWFFVHDHNTLFRVACGLMIAGLAFMSYQLHRRASARGMPSDLGAVNALQFHRAELERQLDFLRHIWRWYLWPMIPGLSVFALMALMAAHRHPLLALFMNLFFAFCLILVWRLNAYAARCLQKRIDELSETAAG
jgi:hypothetical protein